MKFLFTNILLVFILLNQTLAQTLPKPDADILQSLEHNLGYLADDRMEGRLVGSRGEKMAYEFIVENFQSLNLRAKGDQGFLQEFVVKKLSYKAGSLTIKNKTTTLDFSIIDPAKNFPLEGSAVSNLSGKCVWVGYGIDAPSINYNSYLNKKGISGKVFVMLYGHPEPENPHSKFAEFATVDSKIEAAIKNGAKGIIFVNNHTNNLEPDFKPIIRPKFNTVPIYFLGNNAKTDSATFVNAKVDFNIDTTTIEIKGHNIIGYIDYKAEKTIIIGAHYDHLGYNELGGSTYRKEQNEKPQIHNGADDNASGTVALMELAEIIQKSPYRTHNYLFIAFSGEEEGLLGSRYFVEHPTIKLEDVNYMINMDMVGRLDTIKNSFAISGTGTSPTWDSILPTINISNLKVKFDESGTGASDHTSFYNVGIPVLHYFTDNHSDYHKPSDDWELINFDGELKIIKHIYSVIGKLDKSNKLKYTKTKDVQRKGSAFKVTLGIMPDYLFEGVGVKVDGTTPGKPAATTGILRGDIVTKLGEIDIKSMDDYMTALGKFDKGQTIPVNIIRAGQTLELKLTF